MKSNINHILSTTVANCFDNGKLNQTPLPDYTVEVPNHTDHGHFATNLPLTLASSQRRRPTEIARIIVDHLTDPEGMIEKVEIAGPGFINFFIKTEQWHRFLAQIIQSDRDFGRSRQGDGEKVLVEYVSSNPTGPLHLGHGRGAALGDTLCRILSHCGYGVTREFYINDAGNQIQLLGESIYSRWKQMSNPDHPFPENAYHGDYIVDLAKEISGKCDLEGLPQDEAVTLCATHGKEKMLDEIKKDLGDFGMTFDVWYSETDLFSSGLLDESLEKLKDTGRLYEKDGALWIETSALGDDKDRVIKKSDGGFTYFASDISYHLEKWKRGFSKAVDIWGADHHGYVPRMKAALKANDIDEDWLTVLLIQLVKLYKGGQELKMSKRAGQFVTLRELMDEVGVGASRFVFLSKSHDSPLDFDIDLVKKHDSDNPVYYVQYAHARICSIFRKAEEEGVLLPQVSETGLERLCLDEEMALIRLMAEFPSLLENICKAFEPHRLTYYLTELASLFHRYFNLGSKNPENRIVCEDISMSHARLFLAQGIRIVLYNGLDLLGIDAPERM